MPGTRNDLESCNFNVKALECYWTNNLLGFIKINNTCFIKCLFFLNRNQIMYNEQWTRTRGSLLFALSPERNQKTRLRKGLSLRRNTCDVFGKVNGWCSVSGSIEQLLTAPWVVILSSPTSQMRILRRRVFHALTQGLVFSLSRK